MATRHPALLLFACVPGLHGASVFAMNHGAIAYDRSSGAWGASYNYSSQRAADARALNQCARFSRSCSVVVQFWNTCAAYAAGNGTSYGWGSDAIRRNAERRALIECGRHGGNCQVKVSACNTIPAPSPSTSSGPQLRPRYSCWYPNGHRVPDCRD